MLTEDLFRKVLIEPATKEGINRLLIVSGFATASMADKHMEELKKLKCHVDINLIIGMTRSNGIEEIQHMGFKKLAESEPYNMDFSCHYVADKNPVHAKTYCWLSDDKPKIAFIGSANYTRTGFGRSQVEIIETADPIEVFNFYKKTKRVSTDCLDTEIANKVDLKRSKKIESNNDNDSVTLSLLVKNTGETPTKSGINWGQRKGRDRNQAYINIPSDIRKLGFSPDRYEPFTVLTDDNDSFIMVRAQDSGKGLHTTQKNALLGEYLRVRMRIPSGQYVKRQHLLEYGRTDVTFIKIDEETYLMDFRPNLGPGEDSEIWED